MELPKMTVNTPKRSGTFEKCSILFKFMPPGRRAYTRREDNNFSHPGIRGKTGLGSPTYYRVFR